MLSDAEKVSGTVQQFLTQYFKNLAFMLFAICSTLWTFIIFITRQKYVKVFKSPLGQIIFFFFGIPNFLSSNSVSINILNEASHQNQVVWVLRIVKKMKQREIFFFSQNTLFQKCAFSCVQHEWPIVSSEGELLCF